MKLLFDNILVRPKPLETKTAAGILIPESAQKDVRGKTAEGQAYAVGEGVKTVRNGDFLLFNAFVGQAFEKDGKQWLIVKESEVLVVFDDLRQSKTGA